MIGREPHDFYERPSDEWSDGSELELSILDLFDSD